MKKVLIFITILGIFLILPTDISADENHALLPESEARALDNSEDQISPQKDIIRWKFKTINGHIYKRQYNHSKSKWIGSWQAI